MSVQRTVTLRCDGSGWRDYFGGHHIDLCGEPFESGAETATAARILATQHGWTNRGGKDRCEGCTRRQARLDANSRGTRGAL